MIDVLDKILSLPFVNTINAAMNTMLCHFANALTICPNREDNYEQCQHGMDSGPNNKLGSPWLQW
jgi:hypothetical protein